jgi:hypothetical protein
VLGGTGARHRAARAAARGAGRAPWSWLGQGAYLDAAYRGHAWGEDCIRTGKDTGLERFPSRSLAINTAWLNAATLLALEGQQGSAESKTLRYRLLCTAACLVPRHPNRGGPSCPPFFEELGSRR